MGSHLFRHRSDRGLDHACRRAGPGRWRPLRRQVGFRAGAFWRLLGRPQPPGWIVWKPVQSPLFQRRVFVRRAIRRQPGLLPGQPPSTAGKPRAEFSNTGRQGDRSDRQTNRSDNRGDRSDNRSEDRGDRQDQRTDRQDNRQDGRSDRTEQRQDGRSDRVDSRSDNFDNYWNDSTTATSGTPTLDGGRWPPAW